MDFLSQTKYVEGPGSFILTLPTKYYSDFGSFKTPTLNLIKKWPMRPPLTDIVIKFLAGLENSFPQILMTVEPTKRCR